MRSPFRERAALGAVGRKNVDHGEVAGFIERDGEAITGGEIRFAENRFDGAHFRDGAGKHNLNGIFGDGIFERGNDANIGEVALVVGVADGIVLTKRFEHDLIGDRSIENDGCAFAPGPRGFEDAARNVSIEQMAKMGFSVGGANKSAVIDDHGQRAGELVGDGHGEIVATAGDESDFNAATGSLGNGGAIGFGELPAAVEERSVDVESNKAYRHRSKFTAKRWKKVPRVRAVSEFQNGMGTPLPLFYVSIHSKGVGRWVPPPKRTAKGVCRARI